MSIYRCCNRRCKKYHVEFTALGPAAARLATGRAVRCDACGDIAWWVRNEDQPPPVEAPDQPAPPR